MERVARMFYVVAEVANVTTFLLKVLETREAILLSVMRRWISSGNFVPFMSLVARTKLF